jgi:hypothetical protein
MKEAIACAIAGVRMGAIGAAVAISACSSSTARGAVVPVADPLFALTALPRSPIGGKANSLAAAGAGCAHRTRVRIRQGGGTFAMPSCAGWRGAISYPLGNQRYEWSVTTSTTNSFGAPTPPSGTAIFYMQTKVVTRHRLPAFANTGVMNTVSSPALSSDHGYTLFVYGFAEDSQCPVPPPSRCPPWVMNLGSPAPNSHSLTFVSPFNGALFGGIGYLTPVWQFVQD